MILLIIIECVLVGFCSCLQPTEIDTKNSDFIVLLESELEGHVAVNDDFVRITKAMGINNIRRVHVFQLSDTLVNATFEADRIFTYVINLKFPPIITNCTSYGILNTLHSSNLICANDCDFKSYSRLVSIPVLTQYESLSEIIAMDNISFLNQILVCLPTSKIVITETYQKLKNISKMKLNLEYCNGRTEIPNNTLAVLAEKPLHGNSDVPIIFYKTPNNPEYKDHFPNSIDISPPRGLLKNALMSFLQSMQWYRVAIVSDDSDVSRQFAEELSTMFVREGFAFTAQECEGRHCDFVKVLKTLKEADAKIIIMNVHDEKSGDDLSSAIENVHMSGVKWILLDWPLNLAQEDMPWLEEVYSISLFPVYRDNWDHKNIPHFSTMVGGVQLINKVFRTVKGDKKRFRRDIRVAAKNRPKYINIYAGVTRHRYDRGPRVISYMTVDYNGAKVLSFSIHEQIPSDMPEACIVRGLNFFTPCQHETLLLLVTVLIMFTLMILVTVLYFKTYRHERHYNRFH